MEDEGSIPAGQDDGHSSSKVIRLVSSDGVSFEIRENVALQFGPVKTWLEDEDITDSDFIVYNVDSKILAKVIDYCEKHAESKQKGVDLKSFDERFLSVNQDTLFGITRAAHYLNIKSLLDLTTSKIAREMRDMNLQEVRQYYKIHRDFSTKEELEIIKEHDWAHQGLDSDKKNLF